MNIDIDLEQEQEQLFYLFLKQNHIEVSDFFKKVVLDSLTEDFKELPLAYDLGKEIFGRFSSGETERSVQQQIKLSHLHFAEDITTKANNLTQAFYYLTQLPNDCFEEN